MQRLQMVPLVCQVSMIEAGVLAARLGAEGIVWEHRGASSVYPVGYVDVLVAADDLPLARELLLADEIEAVFFDDRDEDRADEITAAPGRWSGFVFGATLVMVTSALLLYRLLSL
jgi:hypothetical protein